MENEKYPLQHTFNSAFVTLRFLEDLFKEENKDLTIEKFLSQTPNTTCSIKESGSQFILNSQFYISIMYSTLLVAKEKIDNSDSVKSKINKAICNYFVIEQKKESKSPYLKCLRNALAHYHIEFKDDDTIKFYDIYPEKSPQKPPQKPHFSAEISFACLKSFVDKISEII